MRRVKSFGPGFSQFHAFWGRSQKKKPATEKNPVTAGEKNPVTAATFPEYGTGNGPGFCWLANAAAVTLFPFRPAMFATANPVTAATFPPVMQRTFALSTD
jgi:hypothetical protein